MSHPVIGTHERFPGLPFRPPEGAGGWHRRPAPTFGQHNDEVLRDLGLDADEIRGLRNRGVVGERPLGV